MKIKLSKMIIRNFKGFKEYELIANGNSVNVSGDNGSGKTSLYDAFLWALFGKNSQDQSDTKFDWKPLDKDNEPIHHLETSVEVFLKVNGKETVLKRTITEDWQRVRNALEETFKGHTTTYQIDGITVKQKDYKDYLEQLIGEQQFKVLTNISYFPEKMKMDERRQMLIDMVGDVSDLDVIEMNSELKPLSSLIEDKSIEDITILTEQEMREINKQIKLLPGRIDEVDRSLPDISDIDVGALNQEKMLISETVESIRVKISDVKNGLEAGKLRQEKHQLELQYKEKAQEFNESTYEEIEHWQSIKDDLKNQLDGVETRLFEVVNAEMQRKDNIRGIRTRITQLEKENEENRSKFITIRDETMPDFDEHRTTCPTCGQDFLEDKILEIQANYQKEVEEFNAKKAEKLAAIQARGKENNEIIEGLRKEVEELGVISTDEEIFRTEKNSIQERITEINSKISTLRNKTTAFEESEESKTINTQIIEIGKRISKVELDSTVGVSKHEERIKELNTEISEIDNQLYLIELHDKQSKRKEELISEDQMLSTRYGQLEQQKFLLEEFVRTKVNLLTDSINNRFKMVKFKLFETAINGGLKEVCEPTVNGVPYSTSLNNAAKINAGLDIVNTLMDNAGIKVPVFVDNAESINELIDIDTQVITLTVTKHKTLRVEEQTNE